MLNFGASKPRVKGGLGPRGPLDPHLLTKVSKVFNYQILNKQILLFTWFWWQ